MTFKRTTLCAVAALAVAGTAGAALAQERTFRLGLITPPVHVWNQEARAMGETLMELSDGRFDVTTFPSGQLGNESAMMQQLQTGALDMAWITTAEVTFRVPDMAALHAPFLVDNIDDAVALLRSEPALEILQALPAATGTTGVCYGTIGMRQLVTVDPIDSVEDLSGMRFRITPAPPISTFFEAFGAAPAPMPLTQVYDALANGQIDGFDMDYESIINFRYYEHAPNLMITNHHMFAMVALVSGRVWASLSPEDQEIVRTAMQTHCDNVLDRFAAEEAAKLEQLKATEGVTVVEGIGPEFFGDIVAEWDAEWASETDYVARLRAEAAAL